MIVTNGAYEDLYKHLGYTIVKEEVKEEVEEIPSLASNPIDNKEEEKTVKSEEIPFKSTSIKRKK